MTETFIYYELHILGVRGPPWGTLPHKCIFFFPVFLFFVRAVTLALRRSTTANRATRSFLVDILNEHNNNYMYILSDISKKTLGFNRDELRLE